MKNFKLAISILALATLSFVLPAAAQSIADPLYNAGKLAGLPQSMPTQSYSNSFTNTPIPLVPLQPLALWHTLATTNAGGTSNLVFTYQLGYDGTGTNFATTPTLTATAAANGTNPVVFLQFFNTNQLQGARFIRLYSIQNTNVYTVTIGKVVAGQFRVRE